MEESMTATFGAWQRIYSLSVQSNPLESVCYTRLSKSAASSTTKMQVFEHAQLVDFLLLSVIVPVPITLGNPFILSNIFRREVQRKVGQNTPNMMKTFWLWTTKQFLPRSGETLYLENFSLVEHWC